MPISLSSRFVTVVAQGINRFMKPARSMRVQGDQSSEIVIKNKKSTPAPRGGGDRTLSYAW
jgi:hypothetical protein